MKKKTRSRSVSSNFLFGPPPILAGEDETAYDELIGRVYAAIKPVDVIDEMLIADTVASEWEFLRWSRLKLSLIQACAAKGLKEFLNSKLEYDLYREGFVQDLTEILQDNLPEEDADRLQRLARDCATGETDAIDSVNEILSGINLRMGRLLDKASDNRAEVLDKARDNRAEELVKEYVRRESGAVALIDDLLAKAGMTIDALIASHLDEQLQWLERVDRLTTIAETRRNASLREIDRRRSALGGKLRRSIQEIEEPVLIETTAGKGKDAA
jgi:hypothetical protein